MKMLFSLCTVTWKEWGSTDRQQTIQTIGFIFHFVSDFLDLVHTWSSLVSQPLFVVSCVSAAYHKGSKGWHDQESVLQRRFSGQQTRSFSRVWERGIWQKWSRMNCIKEIANKAILSIVSLHQKEKVPSCFSWGLINSNFTKWLRDYVKTLSYLRIMHLGHKYNKLSQYFILIKLNYTFLLEVMWLISASDFMQCGIF